MKEAGTPGKGASKTGKSKAKDRGERPPRNEETAPANPPQKTKPDAVTTPQKQATAPDDLPPGAWVLPWAVRATGDTNAALVLCWLMGIRVAASGPALAFHRTVSGNVSIAAKKAKLGALLGLTEDAVKKAVNHLRELGLVTAKVREDGGTKVTFFHVDMDAARKAVRSVSANKEETE